MHISIPVDQSCEFLNVTPVNPLISKCQIKVCYVGEEPNRNGSIITKEAAIKMAPSLLGSPIVGFYNRTKGDFEEHNKIITISNGEIIMSDQTVPYGFVDLNAKVWFKKFLDDGVEHEYLMTEGYIWTGQYEEAKRIIAHGNNQSMELDGNYIDASWAEDDNGTPRFFIINNAVISKLCILGEDVEPCFEGAQITAPQFSLSEDFKAKFVEMAKELKDILQEGGNYSMEEDNKVAEEFADKEVCPNCGEDPCVCDKQKEEVCPECGKNPCVCEDFAKKEDEEVCPECGKAPCVCENACGDKEDKKYNLEEVVEYTELQTQYSELETKYNELNSQLETLNTELAELKEFKATADKKAKLDLVNSFYMLSDEDKKEVVDNIDTYSLKDIEAELSILCVRNKVNFNLDEEIEKEDKPKTFSIDNSVENDVAPAWVQAVRDTMKNKK